MTTYLIAFWSCCFKQCLCLYILYMYDFFSLYVSHHQNLYMPACTCTVCECLESILVFPYLNSAQTSGSIYSMKASKVKENPNSTSNMSDCNLILRNVYTVFFKNLNLSHNLPSHRRSWSHSWRPAPSFPLRGHPLWSCERCFAVVWSVTVPSLG